MSSTWPARLDVPARGHERSRSREACRATVAPQSTQIQGGYRPPERFTTNPEPVDLQAHQAKLTPRGLASNPGSGTSLIPTNEPEMAGSLVQWRTNPATAGTQKVVARPDTGRYEDRLAAVGRWSNG